jgi:TetR/AcrR family transcriptional repressor for divergent bdcA
MRLFAARGYDAVGVAELSEELGISPPSLYATFGNKRGLFERALRLYSERYGGELPKALESEARIEDAVEQLFLAAAEAYTAESCAAGCMVMEGSGPGQDSEASALVMQAQESFRQIILDGIRRAETAEPEILADYVLTALRGMSASARRGMHRDRLREVAKIASQGFSARLAGSGCSRDKSGGDPAQN